MGRGIGILMEATNIPQLLFTLRAQDPVRKKESIIQDLVILIKRHSDRNAPSNTPWFVKPQDSSVPRLTFFLTRVNPHRQHIQRFPTTPPDK